MIGVKFTMTGRYKFAFDECHCKRLLSNNLSTLITFINTLSSCGKNMLSVNKVVLKCSHNIYLNVWWYGVVGGWLVTITNYCYSFNGLAFYRKVLQSTDDIKLNARMMIISAKFVSVGNRHLCNIKSVGQLHISRIGRVQRCGYKPSPCLVNFFFLQALIGFYIDVGSYLNFPLMSCFFRRQTN